MLPMPATASEMAMNASQAVAFWWKKPNSKIFQVVCEM